HELDDVGLPSGDGEDLPPTTADHDRGTGSLDRGRRAGELADRVVLAGEAERLLPEEPLEDDGGLLQAGDALGGGAEPHAGVLVLLAQPARPESDLQPALR